MIKFLLKFLLILNILSVFVTKLIYASDETEINTSPKIAKIIVPRAVIYADENLITPLGYIPNGKLITVGNPRRLNQEIVPTLVSGRIGFLELKDIEYQDEKLDNKNMKTGYLREHNVDIVLRKPEEKLNENNHIYFQFGRFEAGDNLRQIIYDLEGNDASWMTSFGTFFLHRSPVSRFFWGGGFEYNFVNSSDMHLRSFMVNPTFGATVIRNVAFSLDTFINLDFSTSTYFDIDNNYSEDPAGFMWGPQVGIRLILSPNTKYKIISTLSYRIYKAYDLDNLNKIDPNDQNLDLKVNGLTTQRGINISFGIGFDL